MDAQTEARGLVAGLTMVSDFACLERGGLVIAGVSFGRGRRFAVGVLLTNDDTAFACDLVPHPPHPGRSPRNSG